MTQAVHHQPDVEEQEPGVVYSKAGYSFPMGPVIPRPDARKPPLWPGLIRAGLNRPKAAAIVVLNAYRNNDQKKLPNGEVPYWKISKEPLTSRLDLAFRNWWLRVHPEGKGEFLDSAKISLRVLDRWVSLISPNSDRMHLRDLVNSKLKPDIQNFYRKGRSDARKQQLLFAAPHYPVAGMVAPRKVIGESWGKRYSEQTRNLVRELLLKPAGEWELLALLFNKLLHVHMAWMAPGEIRVQRQILYYRPLLQQLRWCAMQAGTSATHPLAEVAAGIWGEFRRMNSLFYSRGSDEVQFPKHPDPLDPRNNLLPACLHMDAALTVGECLSEVNEIVDWMASLERGVDWMSILPLVENVAYLAWEMASLRTDPFSMGGVSYWSGNRERAGNVFRSIVGDCREIIDQLGAYIRSIESRVIDEGGLCRDVRYMVRSVSGQPCADSLSDWIRCQWLRDIKSRVDAYFKEEISKSVHLEFGDNLDEKECQKEIVQRLRGLTSDQVFDRSVQIVAELTDEEIDARTKKLIVRHTETVSKLPPRFKFAFPGGSHDGRDGCQGAVDFSNQCLLDDLVGRLPQLQAYFKSIGELLVEHGLGEFQAEGVMK